jgi:hypothetical protein
MQYKIGDVCKILPSLRSLTLKGVKNPFELRSFYGSSLTHLGLVRNRYGDSSSRNHGPPTLAGISRLPLTSLDLSGCTLITNLDYLRGMQLESLNITGCRTLLDERDGSTDGLRGLPLARLAHGGASDRHMEIIATSLGATLVDLDLTSSRNITNAGLFMLRKLRLRRLCLAGCTEITYQGIAHLVDMPLERLDLRNTRKGDNRMVLSWFPKVLIPCIVI